MEDGTGVTGVARVSDESEATSEQQESEDESWFSAPSEESVWSYTASVVVYNTIPRGQVVVVEGSRED